MTDIIHLEVEKGPDQGKKITVSPEGSRVGRSSKNDVVLIDPLLSRHHCRLFFKTGDGLWVTDLGSANQTLVNDSPAQEVRLRIGDTVTIGDTTMRVINDGISVAPVVIAPAVSPSPSPTPVPPSGPAAIRPPSEPPGLTPGLGPRYPAPNAKTPAPKGSGPVDLGLSKEKPAPGKKLFWGPILLAEMLIIAGAIWIFWPKIQTFIQHRSGPAQNVATTPSAPEKTLEIEYEKVQASPSNIFRHSLTINRDNIISVEIDDLENNRHVRKEKKMDRPYCQNLAKSIIDAGFFTLDNSYEGILPEVTESWSLTVTVGTRTHRVRVHNRVEPDVFKNVREIIEDAGKNELGLEAIQFSTDKLLSMAEDCYLMARKLFDEREIKFDNLAEAIRSLKEADLYLETVEPKPDYYPDLRTAMTDWAKELDARYKDQEFRASRAVRMREWEEASKELQVLMQMVPDRADPRNQKTRKELLDVENRLKEKK